MGTYLMDTMIIQFSDVWNSIIVGLILSNPSRMVVQNFNIFPCMKIKFHAIFYLKMSFLSPSMWLKSNKTRIRTPVKNEVLYRRLTLCEIGDIRKVKFDWFWWFYTKTNRQVNVDLVHMSRLVSLSSGMLV